MERFARVVIGYHGCEREFANRLLQGELAIADWEESRNVYDWLGKGIYFWEHAPERAKRWAVERGKRAPDVIGAVIQLGRCFDLMDEAFTDLLVEAHRLEQEQSEAEGRALPTNSGGDQDLKLRKLDCHIINACLQQQAPPFQTVRGAFWEGGRAYPEAMIYRESHVQIAVRDRDCILGVFRPNLRS